MKKVGIITFHGAHNYGSVLQSYASVVTLRGLGYDPEIINLRNQAQLDAYKILKSYKGLLRAFRIIIYPWLLSRRNKFEHFINNTLPLSDKEYRSGSEINVEELDYDIYYTGSDQVWNPTCQDFESAYYLDFVNHARPTVAYAPSMGKGTFDKADKDRIMSLLSYVDYLSCREATGARLISELSGRPAVQVCDPVLLPTKEEWADFAIAPHRKRKYILAYFLNNNHGDRSQLEYLRKQTGYDMILLNEYIRDNFNPGIIKKYNASPQEFLGLIKDAEFVYTNSFHATAFSVIFHKKFFTAIAASDNVHNNNDSRKIDFLRSLGLENRLLMNGAPINIDEPIDYEKANLMLSEMRARSMAYLKNALEGK